MDSDQGKLFIGGISWETSEERLAEYFSNYGEVVQTVIMKDRMTGRARGFGFVVFADPSILDRVLQDKHTIDGRTVEAKKAVPREEQQNARANSYNNNGGQAFVGGVVRTKKIFVGGLPANLTEEEFKIYFQQFGTINDVVVMYDHSTQRPRGFGFITFDLEDSVENVLLKNFHELNGKLVEVKRALPKDASSGGGGRGGGGYQGYNNSNSNVGGYEGRMDNNRYGQPPAGRGGFPSFPPAGYGAPNYGSGGYGAVNTGGYGYGNYGMNSYGGAPPGAPAYGGAGGGYGSTPVPNSGFGNGPVGAPRSPWGNAASAGYGSQANSASYGTNTGYGAANSWPSSGAASGTAGQSPSGGNGYTNPNYGYGYANNEGSYNANAAGGYGGPGRGGATPNYNAGNNGEQTGTGVAYAGGYGDPHGNSGYSDTVWKSGVSDPSAAGFNAAPTGGYGVPHADGTANGQAAYGGYGAAGRQSQRQ
ncbi:heterogeneous nuclear ribonucleoprotein 1 [Cryptomeria japonica]|uniref:heterogeneous nuclear ribonucleoprotein 1 n=1 Tax=Cryptomeria japonica TaxID=3369 RepID=UPI0027D9FA77|nr:heterogeneous nuclear ribonucleoprotein 1 [Cryptomeria japonica]